jgi:anti-sigma-K factor RskA
VHTERIKYLLPDYLQGTLEEGVRQEIELHLQECADCRDEVALLQLALRELDQQKRAALPPAYNASVLSRIQWRLEQRERFAWVRHPLFSRVAVPLAVAVLAIAVLVRLPLEHTTPADLLSVAADDAAELLVHQQELAPMQYSMTQDLAGTAIPIAIVNRQLAERLVLNGPEQSVEVWPDLSADRLFEGWTEEEVETLVQRLEKRVILE